MTAPFACFWNLPEEYNHIEDKSRDQDGAGPTHVTKEAGHFDLVFFGDGFDHEVRRVADIGVCPHEYGAG